MYILEKHSYRKEKQQFSWLRSLLYYKVRHLKWNAQEAARQRVEHCEAQALEHYRPSGKPRHFQTLIDVQGITVMCAMGAAAAPDDPVVTAAWAEAVEHCRVTAQLARTASRSAEREWLWPSTFSLRPRP